LKIEKGGKIFTNPCLEHLIKKYETISALGRGWGRDLG
jgi:hypothetical protein